MNGKTVSRRTVVKGSAWAVPAVLVTAPVHAVSLSGCIVQSVFDSLRVGSCPTTIDFSPSTVTATLSYSSTGNGGDPTPGGTGCVERTSTAPAWNYIEVEMLSPLAAGDSVTVTITLSQAMERLSFKIHDIDAVTGAWQDTVVVNTAGYTWVPGGNIIGSGTVADPFRNSTAVDNPISSGLGDVQLTWAGPIQAVSFKYIAGITGNSQNQHVGLGNISFEDCVANPPETTTTRSLDISKGVFEPGPAVAESQSLDATTGEGIVQDL